MKKNPSTLVSQEKINPTQRKSIGAGEWLGPRMREENEALPITFKESELPHMTIPVMVPPRANSVAFLAIKSRGVQC
jgi:hypothetical protein